MAEIEHALDELYAHLESEDHPLTPEVKLFTALAVTSRLHLTVRESVIELLLSTFSCADEVWALELTEGDGQALSFTGWIDSDGNRHADPRLDPEVDISDHGLTTWERVDTVVAHLRPQDCVLPPFVPGTRSASALLPIVRADLGQDL